MSVVLVVLVLAPLVGALWAGGVGRRHLGPLSRWVPVALAVVSLASAATLAVAAATGSRPAIGDRGAEWVRADELAVVLSVTVALLGVLVLAYAVRNLDGDPLAWRFHAMASSLLAGTLLLAVAARFSILALAWLLTTATVLGLIAHRGDRAGRAAARRAGLTLALGDAAFLAALAVAAATVGDPGLTAMGDTATALVDRSVAPLGFLPSVSAATVVGVLLTIAASARAAQILLPGWLAGTLAAPTPVSALLHAGVVNAGGFVLVRFGAVLGAAPVATVLLAVIALASVAVAGGSALVRPDVKGALAASTSAQMGFMLLAVAVGAPVAAVTHLVGHALYKAARFLGAGDAIQSAVTQRRRSSRDMAMSPGVRTALSIILPAVSLGLVWVVLRPDVLHGADGWVVGAATAAAAVHATWTWLRRAPGPLAGVVAASVAAVSIVAGGYLTLASLVERFLLPALVRGDDGFVDPRLALGVLGLLFAGGFVLARHPRGGPRLYAALAGLGQPPAPIGARRGRVRAGATTDVRGPVLEGAR